MSWDDYVFEDPYESYDRGQEDAYSGSGRYRRNKQQFVPDPLYYHTHCSFTEIVADTPKALLFLIDEQELWVPRALCKELNLITNTVYIHTDFLNEHLE